MNGVEVKKIDVISDARGWLGEVYRSDDDIHRPVMSYISMTHLGQTRGPHEHNYQTDYFVFLGTSEFKLFLWDNRGYSADDARHLYVLPANEIWIAKIPPNVIHAYKNSGSDNGLIINLPNQLYRGFFKKDVVDEIRHETNPKYVID